MYGKFQQHLRDELAAIDAAGLYKRERNIASAQGAEITLEDGSVALNFCADVLKIEGTSAFLSACKPVDFLSC